MKWAAQAHGVLALVKACRERLRARVAGSTACRRSAHSCARQLPARATCPGRSHAPGAVSSAAARMTTAEATVAALIAHGIDTIYALPGVHNDHLFDALFKAADRIRTVHTRHEQGAAYMALGAALATGKPQAYTVVPGPGLLNSAAALLTAYGMNAPVLALIGQIPRPRSGAGSATCTRSAIRPASSPAWSIFPPASATRPQAAGLVARSLARHGHGPPRPGGAGMRDRRVGTQRAGSADRSRPLPAPTPPIDEDAVGEAAKRLARRQAAADRRRRRRAGCGRRGHRVVAAVAGAGARLSARPRRARQPRSAERHAAARPRIVGRSRRGARRRHAAVLRLHAMGDRPRSCGHPRRCRPRGAGAFPPAGGRARRRRQADPAPP